MDFKKLHQRATVQGIETPGLLTLSWRALGRSKDPIIAFGARFEIPKQDQFLYLDGVGRKFASFTANKVDGDSVIKGRLLVCVQNHIGFFVPEEVQ